MKIVTVKYGYTFNRGNFQSERIDLEAQLEPRETEQMVYYDLKARVHDLGNDPLVAQKYKNLADKLRSGEMRIDEATLPRATDNRARITSADGRMRIVDEPLPQSNPPYKNDI